MSVLSSELRRIWSEQGALTPALVVEEARDPASPLHSRFEWDDATAADGYRLVQAAGLIREARLRVTTRPPSGKKSFTIREWVPGSYVGAQVPPNGYIPVGELDPAQRDLLVRRMKREVEALRRRYGHLEQFWQLIDQLRAEGPEEDSA